jgi:N utilization substance protein A
MSQEIVDAVKALGTEKGISEEKLMLALEDALLSAYKKQPGSAKYAKVELDRDTGDFVVWELQVPEELEETLISEAWRAMAAEQAEIDPETGERREPEEPELDLEKLAEYQDQIPDATSRRTTSAASPPRPPSR